MVAAPCVLGSQCVVFTDRIDMACLLLGIGLLHWLVLCYAMLPGLMTSGAKPSPELGLSGAWLLVVVGTQAISVLTSTIAQKSADMPEPVIFASLCFWFAGSMIYFWIISQIFNRILFLPLSAVQLTPPYWISMGAMAIATLAGSRLVLLANDISFLAELRPFVKGMTLLYWATATWWIPMLVALGVGRHAKYRFPLAYDHSYWAAVFPLGMYTVATRTMTEALNLPFLKPISDTFVWIALLAWAATFLGFVRWAAKSVMS
jgi:tellurite resistance protein TehA-like permease